MYIELHAASAFSFLEGASLPETLADRAAELGYPALALLDRDGVSGIPRFHLAAKRAGIKAIVGAELTITTGPSPAPNTDRPEPHPAPVGQTFRSAACESQSRVWSPRPPRLWRLPVLVASREGYRHLCRLITQMKLSAPKGEGALALEDLEGCTAGLVALAGRTALDAGAYGVGGLLDRLIGVFGRDNVYVELQRHRLRDEEHDTQALQAMAAAFHVPVVATNGVRFAGEPDRPLFDVLTCIRHKTTIARAGRRLAWNAERFLKPPADMAALFADLPRAVAATRELADRLEYTMADLGYRFPDYPVPSGESQASFLRRITEVGAHERYRPYHDRARAQVARELDLIEKLDLAGYFLIVWDLVNFCRQHGILVQGRGSAANSAVCYSLGITAVDPVGMELLFERFLSEERGEWPDIDLDLPSGDRREQVIQYVYGRYGRLGAAMTANVITYRDRSAAREVGKVLEIDQATIDRMARAMSPFEWRDPQENLARHLTDAGLDAGNASVRLFAGLWARIQDLPRHLGQHSGGMVVCQGRLDEIVPLEPASMPGRVVIQWDKEDCADLGIVKIDLLGLGMMSVLQDALTIVNAQATAHRLPPTGSEPNEPRTDTAPFLDLAHLPPDDPAVYRMLQQADTIGVFQVESRAQMATLPRLKPDHFYDLVVEVAIIRPGPIVGQMVHPYLNRRSGREAVTYPHPLLEPILKRTLGVPLFQEQLLRMAMAVAGFSGGEAEELRRAMGFKRSEARMRQIEQKLRAGMASRGITGETADAVVRSITSFALYGFPESHAASFALLVYASAYLKAHYPAAFYTSLLNNQPMGFYHPATIVKDAQRHGVRFAPIDVQASDWNCRVDDDGSIRLGLRYVRGLREEVGRRLEDARRSAIGVGRTFRSAETNLQVRRAGRSPESSVIPHQEPGTRNGPGTKNQGPSTDDVSSQCPLCGNDDPSMMEAIDDGPGRRWFCNVCAHAWEEVSDAEFRFHSLEHLIAATGIHRDELATLAEIGALNSFGHDRRSALWQIERAVRPPGELFEETAAAPPAPSHERRPSPLRAMSDVDRVIADYDGTGLTIGPHPMALRRRELALRGVLRTTDLPAARAGRRVRVAGAVITRQRPGTAKGFVFLTLEDETGIANVIVRPDVFTEQRLVVVHEPYVIVEGVLQQQDGVTSVRAERVLPLAGRAPDVESHDFH